MPVFKIKGYKTDGTKVRTTHIAATLEDLKIDLKKEGIFVTTSKMLKDKRKNSFFTLSGSKPKKNEFSQFCKEFAIMLGTGVSIRDCIETLRRQKFSAVFTNLISDVYEDVLKGVMLSEAFKKHPKAFPDFFCQMVFLGELSGDLASILKKTSEYYENDQKVKGKTKSAMYYPVFLLVLIVLVVFGLMIFIVPMFKATLDSLGSELPLITQIVLNISTFFTSNWLWIIITAVVVTLGIMFGLRTEKGKYFRDYLTYHTPILKNVKKSLITSRFSSGFAILLGSGMTVVDSMKNISKIIGNKYFDKKFASAISEVQRGKPIALAVNNTNLFPPMLIEMITIGEQSSALEEVLNDVSSYYQEELNNTITRTTALMEPIIIVIMGLVVGVIELSIILPQLSILQGI
ncbi:MAG: type II secretion system F family protein [Bacilli bacterium]